MVSWDEQTPLVGRDRELSAFARLLDGARRGHGGVALVAGEPGIGKTRLLLEFARRARADGWHVLLGRAYEAEGMPPYLPFSEALYDYLRTCRPDEVRAHLERVTPDALRLLPELANALPPSRAESGAVHAPRDPEAERYWLFESVCGLLLSIATAPPGGLLVCIDDLHWADAPTLQLVLHLARKLEQAPVVLVCSYRNTAAGSGQTLLDALADLSRERLRQRFMHSRVTRSARC
jgi:predicted ATPase